MHVLNFSYLVAQAQEMLRQVYLLYRVPWYSMLLLISSLWDSTLKILASRQLLSPYPRPHHSSTTDEINNLRLTLHNIQDNNHRRVYEYHYLHSTDSSGKKALYLNHLLHKLSLKWLRSLVYYGQIVVFTWEPQTTNTEIKYINGSFTRNDFFYYKT